MQQVSRKRKRTNWALYFKDNWQLYAMLLVPVAFVIVFKYAAYPGLRIAFMNYKPAKGYAGSEWVGFQIFEKIFKDKDFIRALKNSLVFMNTASMLRSPMKINRHTQFNKSIR